MNRKRSQDTQTPVAAFIALALMAIVATTGGALHAIYRNGQIKTERKIAEARERIEQHHLDIQVIDVRKERLLDRYEIRAQLELMNSSLAAVDHGVVEKVQLLAQPDPVPVAVRP
ncbi:hypothetical protein HAHE_09970 [Haloferula helveola]|uniref:Cell division protein FtsL n=1 Tax=Haloferula helveola TaxID=490095 RepID=A0ABN6H0L3_9BACT|nr:hypothetical protein HAHE_09970 [Haloferula helveola]